MEEKDSAMKRNISLAIILVILLFCICTSACAAENKYKEIRKEQWIIVIRDQEGLLGYYDVLSGYFQFPIYNSIFDNPDYNAPILVEKNGLWGYIDRKNGKEIIALQYTADSSYTDFVNGYAVIGNQIQTGDGSLRYDYFLIDLDGHQIEIPEEYTIKSGVCGSKKSIVILGPNEKGQYEYGIYRLGQGLVVEPQFETIWFGNCNYFCFRDDTGLIGVINADGRIILEPQFITNGSPITYCSLNNGTSSLYVDGYYTVYDQQGNKIYIFVDENSDTISVFNLADFQTDGLEVEGPVWFS